MNLRGTIRKLEKKRAIDAICRICRGRGVNSVAIDDEVPIGCRVCGRVSTVKRMILAGIEDVGGNSEPKLACGP
jgi:hypothetical protein